jgi:hypothetical protein
MGQMGRMQNELESNTTNISTILVTQKTISSVHQDRNQKSFWTSIVLEKQHTFGIIALF